MTSHAGTGLIRKHPGGQIAIAPVADDCHDDRILYLGGKSQRRGNTAAGRNAGEDALLCGESPRDVLGFGLADIHFAVDQGGVKDLRYIGGRPAPDTGDGCPLCWLYPDDLRARPLLAQIHAGRRDGSSGSMLGIEAVLADGTVVEAWIGDQPGGGKSFDGLVDEVASIRSSTGFSKTA